MKILTFAVKFVPFTQFSHFKIMCVFVLELDGGGGGMERRGVTFLQDTSLGF